MKRHSFLSARSLLSLFAIFFVGQLWLAHVWKIARAEEDHEDDTGTVKVGKPAAKPPTGPQGVGGCGVAPGVLSQFASGERYDLHAMVTYLTQPECLDNSKAIAATEMAMEGVKFSATEPLNLANLTKNLTPRDYDALRKLDASIAKQFPTAFRNNPLGQNELLPLLGQLAILSPGAARFGMVKLMEQEILAADPVLASLTASSKEKKQSARELALNLVRLGANEPVLITELASDVEEMAVLTEADSLSKIFRGLAMATEFEPSLVPTFNASAGAFNRGVQKGKAVLSPVERGKLLTALLSAISTSLYGNERLEPGASDLNDAVALLIEGKPLQGTALKKLWREILRVLASTLTQTSLAEALSLSLTPDMVFLPEVERRLLLEAAGNYPVIGFSIQRQMVAAVRTMKDNVRSGRLPPVRYNEIKARSVTPVVSQILTWEALRISPTWIRAVVELGLVSDTDLEKKFPRQALALYDAWDDSVKSLSDGTRVEEWTAASARQFMIHWTLSQGHIPALTKWVKRYEENAEPEE